MIKTIPASIICKIDHEYIAACQKHTTFPDNSYPIIMEELGEAALANNEGDPEHEIIELCHTIVTCVRRIESLVVQQNDKP